MKKALLIAALIVVAGFALAQWYFSDRGRFTTTPEFTGLERTVADNELHSERDPAVALRFDPAFRYLGGQKFILYGVAATEQHFFIETTPEDELQRLYWIQFEGYLPDKSYTYDYDDSPLRVALGDFEFYADTAFFEFDPEVQRRRGTDSAMVRQFLASKGYAYPRQVVYARLVYLTDASRTKELMIIFMDDLDIYGVTAAELETDGDSADRWPVIEQAHLDRIRRTLDVRATGPSP